MLKNYQILYLGIFILSFFMPACESDEDSELQDQIRQDDKAIQTYLTENNITAEKASTGVYIEPLVENAQGRQVEEGDVVSVLYTMKLLLGDYVVESYTDALHPVKFSHTAESLIPEGLNVEMSHMREGETFRFFIPSNQAFGDYRHNNLFSANSNFVMEIELVDLNTEQEQYVEEMDSIENYIQHNNIQADSYAEGLFFVDTKPGNGRLPDNNGAIRFHYTRKYLDGTVIQTTEGGDPIQVYFAENRLVAGLEAGIKLMREGGEAILIMPSRLAFGKSVQVIPQKVRQDWVNNDELDPKVKPYAPVLYEVRLLGVY